MTTATNTTATDLRASAEALLKTADAILKRQNCHTMADIVQAYGSSWESAQTTGAAAWEMLPHNIKRLRAALEQPATTNTTALADHIADNWPDRKYKLDEIVQRIQGLTNQPPMSATAEAAEILDNLMANIREQGNYSAEATLTFLGQARQCLNVQPAASGAQITDEQLIGIGREWCDDPEAGHLVFSGEGEFLRAARAVLAAATAAAQPAQQPLTDHRAKQVIWDEKKRWMEEAGVDTEGLQWDEMFLSAMLPYFRAAERAHGIGAAAPAGEQQHG